MQRVTVNDATRRRLAETTSLAEICDSDGNIIGIFCPRGIPQDVLEADDVSVEELVEQGKLRTGRRLADVIAELEQKS
jgi:hypothetical protein